MKTSPFASGQHEQLFDGVLRQLEALGYRGDLLLRDYGFCDWFLADNPTRVAPAAAFARTPQSYDSACFAVLLSNGTSGADLVADFRALGAPFAFEVREDAVVYWKVARDRHRISQELLIRPDALGPVFREHEREWSSQDILRAKNIGITLGPQQGDLFIDSGLIPALEKQIQNKLDVLLRRIMADAEKALLQSKAHKANAKDLFRLVFRFLAAKVLRDRGCSPFASLTDFSDMDSVLQKVGRYYGEEQQPLPSDPETRRIVAQGLWNGVDFRNLSVEVLAYIYENTLVDPQSRQILGTHSTPHNIARYIVHHLPFERLGSTDPLIIEPFSGHGIFLVASLQRLRDLLPNNMDAGERHRYFVKTLRGYEVDTFATEVSRLCLMLADFPNHNGWSLYNEDVFSSERFASDVRRAGAVVGNPPFEDFSPQERSRYGAKLSSVHKPAALIARLLDFLPPSGMLGLVLPRAFLDGTSYRSTRESLAQRFEQIDTVGLPDRVFNVSLQESALLIAKEPRRLDRTNVFVTYTDVADDDRERFLSEYAFTRRDTASKSVEEARHDFTVVPLRQLWERLALNPGLASVAEIHRGVEWQSPFSQEKYVSQTPREGFLPGVLRAAEVLCFQPQEPSFLCAKTRYRRGHAWNLSWDQPKVLMNAVRVSRKGWRLAAFADHTGLIASQDFHALWPRNHWSPKTLAAVVNGPIANAFVATHEFGRHNRISTLRHIPSPELGSAEVQAIDVLVDRYVSITASMSAGDHDLPLLRPDNPKAKLQQAMEALLEVDATVLKAYKLPPRMERQLLDFFRGMRRSVPFNFTEYFPESFVPTIPLWMYISQEYRNCSGQFFLSHIPAITDQAVVEALQEVE